MAARQRGEMTKTIILAHQVVVLQGHANSKTGLKSLDHYLKPIERSRKRRRRKADQSELVAAVLERRAAKGAASPPNPAPHTNPARSGGKKKRTKGD